MALLVSATILHLFCNTLCNQMNGHLTKLGTDIRKAVEILKNDRLLFIISGTVAGSGACLLIVSRFLPSNGVHIYQKKTKALMITSIFILVLGISLLTYFLAYTSNKIHSLSNALDKNAGLFERNVYKNVNAAFDKTFLQLLGAVTGIGFGGVILGTISLIAALNSQSRDRRAFLQNQMLRPPPEMEE